MTACGDLQKLDQCVVEVGDKGGKGVALAGCYVLTATHCLSHWDGTGHLALGEELIEEITFKGIGKTVPMQAVFADPFSDLAVLTLLDSQERPRDVEATEDVFRLLTPPVIHESDISKGGQLPVLIRDHQGEWREGVATKYDQMRRGVWVESPHKIDGGASGGPIVTRDGLLLAIVSTFCEQMPNDGFQPHVHLCLPPWIKLDMARAAAEMQEED